MKKYCTIGLYSFSILFLLIYLVVGFIPSFDLSELGRLFLLCGSCLFLYFGGLLLSKLKKDNKPMRMNLYIFFLLYILLLLTLTLFDSMWGRHGFAFVNWFHEGFDSLKNSINLIPFKTIIEFIREFNSMYSSRSVLLNLFGNIIAFMPMAFFLPLLFKKQNKFVNFFVTISLIVLGIETVQLLTSSGKFDIDDCILNVSGACLMYFILKIRDVNYLIKNIFLLEQNKISKKSIIKIVLAFLVILIGAIGVVRFRNKLYQDNYEEYDRINNPSITIIDESDDTCDEALDLFYEDELYHYYFPCVKSDKVYVDVLNDRKYLIKEFMQNKTYNYNINRMLQRLDIDDVSYIKKNKYKYISLDINPQCSSNTCSSPNEFITIENKDILDAKFDYYNASFDNTNNYHIDLHLIPIKEGTTTITISFKDDNKLLNSFQYIITVDKDLNVDYKNTIIEN